MKATDDPNAKIRFWAAGPERPPRIPRLDPASLPPFGHKRFDSYEAFNRWKREYLLEIARRGGVKWKS